LSHSVITRRTWSSGLRKRNGAPCPYSFLAHLFVGNGEVAASGGLVLATDEVRDLLVLGLLNGVLVVLRTLAEELLLDEVDACGEMSVLAMRSYLCNGLTLVKAVLVLLALCSTASSVVELVTNATKEATLALLLRAGSLLLLLALAGVVVIAATSEVLDEIHCE
jgi:hypothetical protein